METQLRHFGSAPQDPCVIRQLKDGPFLRLTVRFPFVNKSGVQRVKVLGRFPRQREFVGKDTMAKRVFVACFFEPAVAFGFGLFADVDESASFSAI